MEIRNDEHLETDRRLADILSRQKREELVAAQPILPRAEILRAMSSEVDRAKMHGEKFASLHEAYAVILEELDEVWEITRQKRRDRSALEMRKEFVQLGAMAIKALESLDNFIGGSV
jgi:hypothetical protein